MLLLSSSVTFGQSAVYCCTVQRVVFDSIEKKLHRCFVFGFLVCCCHEKSSFDVFCAEGEMGYDPITDVTRSTSSIVVAQINL